MAQQHTDKHVEQMTKAALYLAVIHGTVAAITFNGLIMDMLNPDMIYVFKRSFVAFALAALAHSFLDDDRFWMFLVGMALFLSSALLFGVLAGEIVAVDFNYLKTGTPPGAVEASPPGT